MTGAEHIAAMWQWKGMEDAYKKQREKYHTEWGHRTYTKPPPERERIVIFGKIVPMFLMREIAEMEYNETTNQYEAI